MIKISVPNDITFVCSTRLYLFLYRYISSLNFNDGQIQTVSNEPKTIKNTIDFEIDTCAHIYLQLSNDARY
jgi:hypothetical protein